MRLVEAVGSEFFDQVEDLTRDLLRRPQSSGPIRELLLQGGHEVLVFLSHRPPHQVGLRQCEAGDIAPDLHHLLLIDDHAVRLAQNGFQLRIKVRDLLRAVFACDKIADHFHWSGAVQGVHRHKIGNARRLELSQPVLHPGRFKLEEGDRVPAGKQVECFRVVFRQGIQIE